VDWNDPELKQAMEARTARAAPGEEREIERLAIPVFDFEEPPPAIANRPRAAGAQAAPERTELFDKDNPVWYEITQDYGDLKVSIEADRRVQQKFDESYEVYGDAGTAGPRSAGASAEPEVSTFDESNEEGMEGYIAEYTVYKAGVPYTVKIECTEDTKDQCKNTEQIAKDSKLLTYIGGRPAAQ
jgi:hypothetical protein